MLTHDLWTRLRERVASQLGLSFSVERQPELERGIRSLTREMQMESPESCVEWLLSTPLSPKQVETLAIHLTVGETYFFREDRVFDFLKHRLLPEQVAWHRSRGRRLRIWSAGCCTGEEPYSLAILLQEGIPDWETWDLTIRATDVNPHFLQKAVQGIYGNWSFRRTPEQIKEKYFRRKDRNRFEILPSLKRMVNFSYLNLAEDYSSLPHNANDFDLIFCRNVLMYFTPEKAKQVIRRFYDSLVEEGWLVVSSSELSHHLFSPFVTVIHPEVILYRKSAEPGETLGLNFGPPRKKEITRSFPGEVEALMPEISFFIPPDPLETGHAKENDSHFEERPTGGDILSSLYEQRNYRELEELLLVRRSPQTLEMEEITLLSRLYADRGDLPQSLEWCEAALARDRLHAGLYYLRATILQEWGKIEDAAASLKQALYLDPEFVLAYFTLGHLSLRLGKIRESRKQFENALALLSYAAPETVLPESEGMTVGQLREMVQAALCREDSL